MTAIPKREPLSDAQRKKMFLFLLALTLATATAFQGWRTLYNNFAVEVASLTGQQNGIVQSLREVPGFLALLVVYIMLLVREHTLAACSVIVLGIGVGLAGSMPTFSGLIFTTVLMSFGFHYYETVNQSLSLQYFGVKEAPVMMGRLRGYSSGANLLVGGSVFVLSGFLGYPQLFWLFGGVAALVGVWCLMQNPSAENVPSQHKGMVFRRKYWLFYVLCLLAGARRQVFVAFAVFLLVQKFQFSVQEITALFILNNVVNWFLSPAIGRAVNKYGERKMLSLEYAALIGVFVAYAYTDSKLVVAALYVLDHIFFNFALAVKTYFQKIADPKDIAPSMAVSFTINHVAAVVIPALGGALWMVDYRIPFLGAAVLSALSFVFVQAIRVPERH